MGHVSVGHVSVGHVSAGHVSVGHVSVGHVSVVSGVNCTTTTLSPHLDLYISLLKL